MLRSDALKQLREKCLQESGNDSRKANKLLVTLFKKELKKGAKEGIDAKSVSIKALFEGLVDMEGVDLNSPKELAEAVSSSAFTDITTLVMSDITLEPYEVRANEVMTLVREGDAAMTDEEVVPGMKALGGLRRRLETQSFEETDFEEKKVAIRKMDFGRSVSLTFEDIYNDRTGMIREKAQTIGEDAGQHQEQMIVETIECLPRTAFAESASRAFVLGGTAYAQSDFYAADHSAVAGLDGQVNKNTATGGIAATGFSNAFLNSSIMKDERGKVIVVAPDTILVHSLNELTLATLLATERAVGGNYNDINQFGPRGRVKLNPVITPFLVTTANLAYMGNFKKTLLWLWVIKPNSVTLGANTEAAIKRRIIWEMVFSYYGGCAQRDYRYITRITA